MIKILLKFINMGPIIDSVDIIPKIPAYIFFLIDPINVKISGIKTKKLEIREAKKFKNIKLIISLT